MVFSELATVVSNKVEVSVNSEMTAVEVAEDALPDSAVVVVGDDELPDSADFEVVLSIPKFVLSIVVVVACAVVVQCFQKFVSDHLNLLF